MPGYRSYGLSALFERLSINNTMRHRAAGDALATVRIFEKLLLQGGRDVITTIITEHKEEAKLPDCIRPDVMAALPSRPGIFYLINCNDEIIYIGKGNSIRKNIITLLTKNRNKKALRLREELHDIRFEKTGNEVMAAVMEYSEWKKHLPAFNRKQWKPYPSKLRSNFTDGYAVFRGRSDDEDTIIKMVDGDVAGFSYHSHHSQDDPANTMTALPKDNYINYVVHRSILKRHFLRLVAV